MARQATLDRRRQKLELAMADNDLFYTQGGNIMYTQTINSIMDKVHSKGTAKQQSDNFRYYLKQIKGKGKGDFLGIYDADFKEFLKNNKVNGTRGFNSSNSDTQLSLIIEWYKSMGNSPDIAKLLEAYNPTKQSYGLNDKQMAKIQKENLRRGLSSVPQEDLNKANKISQEEIDAYWKDFL